MRRTAARRWRRRRRESLAPRCRRSARLPCCCSFGLLEPRFGDVQNILARVMPCLGTRPNLYDLAIPAHAKGPCMTQPTNSMSQDDARNHSRRRFLRSAVLFGGLAVGGSLLAACQSAASPPAASATAAPAAPPTAAAQTGAPQGGAAPAAAKPTAVNAAAPAAAAGSAFKPNGKIVYANPSKLRTLDTISVYGLQEFQISRQMMEPLLDLTQDGKLTPVLAESWSPSADAKTWTFKLRQNVKFHDGSAFDAKSVIATIQRAKSATISQHQFAFVD